jgi:hypothetical protein
MKKEKLKIFAKIEWKDTRSKNPTGSNKSNTEKFRCKMDAKKKFGEPLASFGRGQTTRFQP